MKYGSKEMTVYIMNEIDVDFLLSSLPGHVYLLDINNRFLACNDLQAKSLGFSNQSQLVGKHLSDFEVGENLERLIKINQSVVTNRIACQVEEKVTALDGKELIFLSNKSPLLNRQGDVVGILGISLDITELKKKEFAKEAATNRMEIALENITAEFPGHVYWKDLNGVYLGCNDNQAKSLGFEKGQDIVGKTDFELPWSRKTAELFSKNDKKVIRSNQAIEIEEESIIGNKKYIMLSQKKPLKDKHGNVIGVLGVSFDITMEKEAERLKLEKLALEKEAEKAKRETEVCILKEQISNLNYRVLEEISDLMPGNFYWKNTDGIYIGCNNSLVTTLGYKSKNDVVGKTDDDLWPEYTTELRENDEYVIRTGNSLEKEESALLANGRIAYFAAIKIPMRDASGKIIGIIGNSLDITAEKEAEKLKLEKLKLEKEAEKAKQEAELRALQNQIKLLHRQAATIAHELRTPLGSLVHSATALEMIAEKESNPKLQTKLKQIQSIIQSETNNANLFIDIIMGNVKDLKNVSTESFQIMDCIYETIERYPHEGDSRELITVTNADDFTVNANKELLVHVLFNLIKNALYFIHSAGKGEITIWTEVGETFNKLHFKDTGTGMASSKTTKIFKEFYSDTGVGTGVGLYFCKRVMLAIDGDITCAARKGKYTHFTMTFPAVKAKSD